jgi:hypothetical protein
MKSSLWAITLSQTSEDNLEERVALTSSVGFRTGGLKPTELVNLAAK